MIQGSSRRGVSAPTSALTTSERMISQMATVDKTQSKPSRKALTHARLKELFDYNPETGTFTRLIARPCGMSDAGQVVGSKTKKGYLRVWIDGYSYALHILAWFYIYGTWPDDQIDHENLDKTNNRFKNLREADNAHNKANSPLRKDNTSGFKNIRLHRPNGRWQAIGAGRKSLGYYPTAEEAGRVAALEGQKNYGDFFRER